MITTINYYQLSNNAQFSHSQTLIAVGVAQTISATVAQLAQIAQQIYKRHGAQGFVQH